MLRSSPSRRYHTLTKTRERPRAQPDTVEAIREVDIEHVDQAVLGRGKADGAEQAVEGAVKLRCFLGAELECVLIHAGDSVVDDGTSWAAIALWYDASSQAETGGAAGGAAARGGNGEQSKSQDGPCRPFPRCEGSRSTWWWRRGWPAIGPA
jgi:hypothetical protein